MGAGSAERDGKRLNARIEKFDFKQPINDRRRLPDQLVQPLFARHAIALFVRITAVGCSGRLAVDEHTKANPGSSRSRPPRRQDD